MFSAALKLDGPTLVNLELLESSLGGPAGSLLARLDGCVTPGSRPFHAPAPLQLLVLARCFFCERRGQVHAFPGACLCRQFLGPVVIPASDAAGRNLAAVVVVETRCQSATFTHFTRRYNAGFGHVGQGTWFYPSGALSPDLMIWLLAQAVVGCCGDGYAAR